MPMYDIHCEHCGKSGEILVAHANAPLICPSCGSTDTRRLLSATSSLTGKSTRSVPGAGDTTCCGSAPDVAGCAGPGSCCGKTG